MPDRGKVIKGFTVCSEHGLLNGEDCHGHYEYTDNLADIIKANDYSKQCPYNGCKTGCVKTLAKDVFALLKEQEARILDWDELEDWENAVWFEDKDEHECYIALIANVGAYDAKFTNVEPGKIHSLDFMRDFYMKEWRCWSARPTIKQRQEAKWK
jgi:hypothetical protein